MNLTILCPQCQRSLRVPENLLGQAVMCPSCSHSFLAPEGVEVAAQRAANPPSKINYDDEPHPAERPAHDDAFDEDDEAVPRRSQRPREKPSKVQAIAVMTFVGGILATLSAVLLMVTIYGLCWPGSYYSLVLGIMAITRGSQLLGDRAYLQTPPSGIAVMQIINIVNCDCVNLTLGIINLVFLNDEEVKAYFRR